MDYSSRSRLITSPDFCCYGWGHFSSGSGSLNLLRRESIGDRLITLLVSVIVLSIFVSLTARPSNTEVLAAVAAYTGVLVAVIGNYPAG